MIDGRRRNGSPASTSTRTEAETLPARGIGAACVRAGISADAVTAFGVILAAATGVAIAAGWFWVGIALLTSGGLADTLDGAVAKAAGTSSSKGAFLDSVADRLSDALIFSGLTWYLLTGRDPKTALIPVAILAISGIVSYERAKAESLGFTAKGGLMERAERLILLGIALALHVLLVPLLVVLLVLTSATAVGRFRRVWLQASRDRPATRHLEEQRRRAEIRWHDWREQSREERARRRQRVRNRNGIEPIGSRLRRVLGPTATSTTPHRRGARRSGPSATLLHRSDSTR